MQGEISQKKTYLLQTQPLKAQRVILEKKKIRFTLRIFFLDANENKTNLEPNGWFSICCFLQWDLAQKVIYNWAETVAEVT